MKAQETEKNNIICYNCERKIDVSDLNEGNFFKCKQCYTTLIKADYFRSLRNKFSKRRNRMIIWGLIFGLYPMPLILWYVTTKPLEIVIFYFFINTLIIFSINYFSKRAGDILFGIVFAELGVFANITRLIFINFSLPKFSDKMPDLTFQVYFFLTISVTLMSFGILRRKKFILR